MGSDRENQPASGVRLALLNSSYQGLSSLYYLVVRSIYVILFARALGVDQYGAYVYSQSWYLLALTFAHWGMNELAIAEHARVGVVRGRAVFAAGYALRLALCSGLVVFLVALAFLVESDPELRLLMVIYAQAVLARGAASWYQAMFVAHERSQFWLYLSIPFLTLEIVVAITLALSGASLAVIAMAQCAVWWLLLLACALVFRRYFGPFRPRPLTRYTRFFLRNGLSLALAALAFSSLGSGLLILCRYFVGTGPSLGEAAFVIQLVLILGYAIKAISSSALPPLARPSEGLASKQSLFVVTIWSQSLLLGTAAFLAGTLLMPPMVVWAIGPDFAAAAGLFARYSWLLIPLPIIYGLRLVLISHHRSSDFLLAIVAGLMLMVLQVLFLWWSGSMTVGGLLAALGVTHGAIALVVLMQVLRIVPMPAKGGLLVPVLLLLCCISLYFYLYPGWPILALATGLLPLLLISVQGLLLLRGQLSVKPIT